VRVRFLLGPAGSGKTFRCLSEIGQALAAAPEGPPLVLVAPKQTTYQLERKLLAQPSICGYTRLHILSFERLARFVFEQWGQRAPELLDEEGRTMVLRGLLTKKRDELKLFRASARLTGFAQQLSLVLRELQRNQLTPELLRQLAAPMEETEGLSWKLQDFAALLGEYLAWLEAHGLQDGDCLLTKAAEAIQEAEGRGTRAEGGGQRSEVRGQRSEDGDQRPEHAARNANHSTLVSPHPVIAQLWVDGFAEFSAQELELLVALLPYCQQATVTLCLEGVPATSASWLSSWSVTRKTFEACRERFERVASVEAVTEALPRDSGKSRFAKKPVLQHLERRWAEPEPYEEGERRTANIEQRTLNVEPCLRLATCADPEAEAVLAAREIVRHVREGGRYREVMVLVRKLEGYHQPLQRVFARYEIPFFLDRRESVSHHPLAEVTRSALRTVTFGWARDDWFAALKTGLAPADEDEIDRLENEALARGWKGAAWQKAIVVADEPELTRWLAELHQRLLPPFHRLALALAVVQNKPTGAQLAAALREFWGELKVEQKLREWAGGAGLNPKSEIRNPKQIQKNGNTPKAEAATQGNASAVHATVWEQMNVWLDNVELAFPSEALSLREWLPILEAGLANLTVGLIPPALDQVLIGAIDRSRNPEVKLALVLGLNETVFPAPPQGPALLTDSDRVELEKRSVRMGGTARQQLARERYYAYIACTRASERVVLTSALCDANGSPLNPSPFLAHVHQLFRTLQIEQVPRALDWRESEHVNELIGPVLRMRSAECGVRNEEQGKVISNQWSVISGSEPQSEQGLEPAKHSALRIPHSALALPALSAVLERVRHLQNPRTDDQLSSELAGKLYGPVLRTSVSRMEQFAACPFKFFVHSGLRAQERKQFELDLREQGTFQHDVLALFHEELQKEGKRWREITPGEARECVERIARGLMAGYRDGLLEASEETRFLARTLTESLMDFIETLVGWMRHQYQFDPVAVELPFGEEEGGPPWGIELGSGTNVQVETAGAARAGAVRSGVGRRLELHGRIDRVDLFRDVGGQTALCVVVDYKSSQKQLDPVLLANGLQLQLLAYLNVLRHWPNPREWFDVTRLAPAGVFYVNLRGRYQRAPNRVEALAEQPGAARKSAYRHTGRFDARVLRQLDARPNAKEGDQFNYRLTKAGEIHKNCREALGTAEFEALLDSVETNLQSMGQQIYEGVAGVAPYRRGAATACDQCDYRSICRIDPWTHRYRVLRKAEPEGA
jgi:ATP-dependent helicase/nuclease subunit B